MGVCGGAAVVLAVTVGWAWGLVAIPVLGLVAWARVRAGRHTAGQAALGLVIGCAAAGVVFPLAAG